jgi:sugar phosphate isomerase/epimerase
MTIKLGAQENLLEGAGLVEKFALAQSVGLDGIELHGAGGRAFAERIGELRAARQAGVVISSVCPTMRHFIGDFDAERRRQAVEDMKVLLSVVVEAGGVGALTAAAFGMFSRRLPPFTPPRSEVEDREVLLEGLSELGSHAAEVGAMVFLEPLNRYEDHMVNTLAQAASLVREVDLDNVAVMADTFHMSIEEASPGASLREFAPLIRHVHVADSNRLEPGAGHYDWDDTLTALGDIGYSGWMVMECGLSGSSAQVLTGASRLLRASRA